MRQIFLTLIISVISIVAIAQKQNITSSAIIFKQYNSENDKTKKEAKILEAKNYIDLAYENSSTSNEPKMWMYRAQIYKMIAFNHYNLDHSAIFKATESHLKCMQPHSKKKNKIMIYKKWPKEEVLEGLVQCGYQLFNQATEEYNSGNYKSSLKYYTAIFDIMPFDEQDQLKRGNITQETILFNDTISNNIKYGKLDASFEEIENVAKLAGMPNQILIRSNEILKLLEKKSLKNKKVALSKKAALSNVSPKLTIDPKLEKCIKTLNKIDIDKIIPIDALLKLNQILEILNTEE